jgi:hypothetical protein
MLTQDDRATLKEIDDIERQIRQLEAQQAILELPIVDRVIKEGDKLTMIQLKDKLAPGQGKFRLGSALRNMEMEKAGEMIVRRVAEKEAATATD